MTGHEMLGHRCWEPVQVLAPARLPRHTRWRARVASAPPTQGTGELGPSPPGQRAQESKLEGWKGVRVAGLQEPRVTF